MVYIGAVQGNTVKSLRDKVATIVPYPLGVGVMGSNHSETILPWPIQVYGQHRFGDVSGPFVVINRIHEQQ